MTFRSTTSHELNSSSHQMCPYILVLEIADDLGRLFKVVFVFILSAVKIYALQLLVLVILVDAVVTTFIFHNFRKPFYCFLRLVVNRESCDETILIITFPYFRIITAFESRFWAIAIIACLAFPRPVMTMPGTQWKWVLTWSMPFSKYILSQKDTSIYKKQSPFQRTGVLSKTAE